MKTATRKDHQALDMPTSPPPISMMIDRGLDEHEASLVMRGFIPQEMEDKWFIYHDAPWVHFHRSWGGICVYKVKLERLNSGSFVLGEAVVNGDAKQHVAANPDKERKLINGLVNQFLLKPKAGAIESYTVIKQAPVKRGFNNLSKDERRFLELAIHEQMKYADIEKEMGVEGSQLSIWWKDLEADREELSAIRKLWSKKCNAVDFWDFHKWYCSADRECHYCGITEDQIFELDFLNRLYTKRLTTRGRTLEIERVEPNKPYDVVKNLTLACYWCNNAKSDEFSEKEFKPIAQAIRQVWDKRLSEEL